ncbi:MAG: MopE-related protein [Sandaracinus sp.]
MRFGVLALGTILCVGVAGCPSTEAAMPDASSDAAPRVDGGDMPDAFAGVDAANCDLDGDGHASTRCGGDDCDDADVMRHPDAMETCDAANRDEDCDPTTFGQRDSDHDDHVDAACCNVDGSGAMHCGDDCDDARSGRHPGLAEVCNDVDDDCDVAIDESVLLVCWTDNDGDTYPGVGATSSMACNCPARTTDRAPAAMTTDCNDTLPDVSPGSPEICGNGRDDDCDTLTDESGTRWYRDCDGDGYGDMMSAPVVQCESPGRPMGCTAAGAGHVQNATDCNDAAIGVHPMQPDLCNGTNEDCDAATADGAGDPRVGMACDGPDADACAGGTTTCMAGSTVSCVETAPNHVEVCGGGDEDCDGTVDEFAATLADCLGRMLPNTMSSICVAGNCEIMGCTAGHEDCNASPGCESTCAWRGCTAGACDDVVSIATYERASGGATCAARRSGAVVCSGRATDGTMALFPQAATGVSNVVTVDGRWALTSDHRVFRQQGGPGFAYAELTGLGSVTSMGIVHGDEGVDQGCFVRSDRTVICSNYAMGGNRGDGVVSTTDFGLGVVSGLSDAVEVVATFYGGCARRAGGSVVCWGGNQYGNLGDGITTHRTCALASGPTFDCSPTFVTVSGIVDAVQLAGDAYSMCARLASGQVRCWGYGVGARAPDTCTFAGNTSGCAHVPVAVPGLSASRFFPSTSRPVVLTTGGQLVEIAADSTLVTLPSPPGPPTDLERRNLGPPHQGTCAIVSGVAWCQGSNSFGEIGDGTTTTRASFVTMSSP